MLETILKFIKSIKPELALASVFALMSVIWVIAGQTQHNPYFTIAAAAFAVATYVTYPPRWILALSELLSGKKDQDS